MVKHKVKSIAKPMATLTVTTSPDYVGAEHRLLSSSSGFRRFASETSRPLYFDFQAQKVADEFCDGGTPLRWSCRLPARSGCK